MRQISIQFYFDRGSEYKDLYLIQNSKMNTHWNEWSLKYQIQVLCCMCFVPGSLYYTGLLMSLCCLQHYSLYPMNTFLIMYLVFKIITVEKYSQVTALFSIIRPYFSVLNGPNTPLTHVRETVLLICAIEHS